MPCSARSSRAWTWLTKIKAVETTSKGMYQDVPVTPVVIQKAEVGPGVNLGQERG